MAEVLSALSKKLVSGHYGPAGGAGIRLSGRRLRGLWQLAGWANFETAAASALESLGLSTIGTFQSAQATQIACAWRIAPDKLLVESAHDLSAFNYQDLAVLNLSHAREAIILSGPAARDLLSQLIAIDVSPAAFRRGAFLQTGIHHVGVLIHCVQETDFEILVPTTWAESVWEVLLENAVPFGVEVHSDA